MTDATETSPSGVTEFTYAKCVKYENEVNRQVFLPAAILALEVFCSLVNVDTLRQDTAEASKMIKKIMLITVASRGHFSVKNCSERKGYRQEGE